MTVRRAPCQCRDRSACGCEVSVSASPQPQRVAQPWNPAREFSSARRLPASTPRSHGWTERTAQKSTSAQCGCAELNRRQPANRVAFVDRDEDELVRRQSRLELPVTLTSPAGLDDTAIPEGFFRDTALAPPQRLAFSVPAGAITTRATRQGRLRNKSSVHAHGAGLQRTPDADSASGGTRLPSRRRGGASPNQSTAVLGSGSVPPDPPWETPDFPLARDCDIHAPPPPPPPPPLGFAGSPRAVSDVFPRLASRSLTVSQAAHQGSSGGAAQGLGLLAPEKPLCPPGYRFNYRYQYCERDLPPPRPRPAPDTPIHAFACKCPAGSSYLWDGPAQGNCWRHGQRGIPASWWVMDSDAVFRGYDTPPGVGGGSGGNAPKPVSCAEGLEFDEEFGGCVDNSERHIPGCGVTVSFRHWSWDCIDYEDAVLDAALHAAERLQPANEMLHHMLHSYYWGGEQGRAWARAMWDFGSDGSLKWWIGEFSEFRLLLGTRTLDAALGKITPGDPWFFACWSNDCVGVDDADYSAYTTYGRINLCPEWFQLSGENQGRIVLHECLHRCNPLWLHRIMRDVEHDGCVGPDGKCYGFISAFFLVQNPDFRFSIYDQENHVTLSTPASVVNTDNWVEWLEARFRRYGCQALPPSAPRLYEFPAQ